MKRWQGFLAFVVAVVSLGGCWWGGPGRSPDRDAYNNLESGFTAGTVDEFVELWTATTDETGPRGLGHPVSSQAGYVHVTSTRSIYAFDPATGEQRWVVAAPERYVGVDTDLYASAVGGADEFVFTTFKASDTVWVPAQVNAATGEWFESEANGRTEGFRPVQVLLSEFSEGAGGTIEQRLFLYGPFTKVLVSEQPDFANRLTLGITHVFHAGVGVGTAPGNGVRAFLVPGGEAAWTTPIDGTRSTSPMLAPDQTTLYVGTDTGTLYALDAVTGAVRWTSDVGSAITATPSLAEGTLFVPTASGSLVALDAGGCGLFVATCAPLWSTPAGAALSVQPASAAGVVFTGAADGTVSAFPGAGCGSSSCAPLWSASTGSRITGAPAVSFGQVYVGTEDGRLVAYGLPAAVASGE